MMKSMGMNKNESKYYHTACLMDEALLLLLEKKDYDYITVKEICEKAGVNRSTFYLHYETVDDLLRESLSFIFSKFTEKYEGVELDAERIRSASPEELNLITPTYIRPYLEFLREYKRIFVIALKKPDIFSVEKYFEDVYARVFDPILDRMKVEERERRYVLAFFISGMHAVIINWIRGGCTDDIDYIMGLIIKFTIRYIPSSEAST